MNDKNDRAIKTGDVVRVTGAYFKNDNGLFLVTESMGDPNWNGSYHSLKPINKNGSFSKSKATGSWPIKIHSNSWQVRIDARNWNREYAEIEVVEGINREHIREYFRGREREALGMVGWYEETYGGGSNASELLKAEADFCHKLAEGVN